MQFILIVLCGIFMGAFNFGFFMLGYYIRGQKKDDDGLVVTEQNKKFVEEMARWRNYSG